MDRDTVARFGVAVLALVALGASAATLDSAVTVGGDDAGGSGFGQGTADGSLGSGQYTGPLFGSDPIIGSPGTICTPLAWEPYVLGPILLFLVVLFAIGYRDTGSIVPGVVLAGVVALPIGLVWSLFAFCWEQTDEDGLGVVIGTSEEWSIPIVTGGADGAAGGVAVSAPDAIAMLLLGVAILASVLLLFTSRGDDVADGSPSVGAASSNDEAAELARVAGEAADAIAADADVENEIYRAWMEMTDVLDADTPTVETPGAFAEAAVDAGMDPEAVAELTELFEDVRYGGHEATEARERRAVAALRRIAAEEVGE